jgi:MT0933-like antitoxin protein
LSEHGDQVEDGIDKIADLAGKKFGHDGQIDQAADKLKDFVADQQRPRGNRAPQPGPKQQRPRPKQAPHPGPPQQRPRARPT